MKFQRNLQAVSVTASLVLFSFLSLLIVSVSAQDTSKIALQRGYRTGYSDGYMSGYRDSNENAARNFAKHSEYTKANRMYVATFGPLEDYRDGYQQGFETGYGTGFEKRSFDASLPTDLRIKGTTTPANATQPSVPKGTKPPTILPKPADKPNSSPNTSGEPIIIIPTDIELIVELVEDVSTLTAKEGDKIQARVVSPYEIAGALIDGRIAKIVKPGRLSRKAQLLFSFDQIRLSETRWSNFNAILTEIVVTKDDNVKEVDVEGTVKGKGTAKRDGTVIGASTGTGLVVGAVVAGPVGAAVGAGVGAAFGVGAVIIEKGKNIKLAKGQQLKIKTTYETQIR
jgi:hypothetical protein